METEDLHNNKKTDKIIISLFTFISSVLLKYLSYQ